MSLLRAPSAQSTDLAPIGERGLPFGESGSHHSRDMPSGPEELVGPGPSPQKRGVLALGMSAFVVLALIVVVLMVLNQADFNSGTIDERARAKAIEERCRQSCSAWLAPQCGAQKSGPHESIAECVSSLAPVFQSCVKQCR